MAARTVLGAFHQVCSKCLGPNGHIHRAEWGCDEPTEFEQARITCFECDEDTFGCPKCEDRRWTPLYVCPKSIRDRDLEQVVRVALWSRDGGPLPAPGGTLEQSASFMDARDVAISAAIEVEVESMKGE